jgi:hypothetical protein
MEENLERDLEDPHEGTKWNETKAPTRKKPRENNTIQGNQMYIVQQMSKQIVFEIKKEWN